MSVVSGAAAIVLWVLPVVHGAGWGAVVPQRIILETLRPTQELTPKASSRGESSPAPLIDLAESELVRRCAGDELNDEGWRSAIEWALSRIRILKAVDDDTAWRVIEAADSWGRLTKEDLVRLDEWTHAIISTPARWAVEGTPVISVEPRSWRSTDLRVQIWAAAGDQIVFDQVFPRPEVGYRHSYRAIIPWTDGFHLLALDSAGYSDHSRLDLTVEISRPDGWNLNRGFASEIEYFDAIRHARSRPWRRLRTYPATIEASEVVDPARHFALVESPAFERALNECPRPQLQIGADRTFVVWLRLNSARRAAVQAGFDHFCIEATVYADGVTVGSGTAWWSVDDELLFGRGHVSLRIDRGESGEAFEWLDDDLTIRLRTSPATALRSGSARRIWSGSVELPLLGLDLLRWPSPEATIEANWDNHSRERR